jgi:starch synthase
VTNVLFIVSECAPLVKTGGLADVAGALPKALADHGVHVRVLLPGYRTVLAQVQTSKVVAEHSDLFGGPAKILAVKIADLDLLILDAPHLYNRDGAIYGDATGSDWSDNPERFAALCKVGASIAADGIDGWRPDVVHGHDWQAGLTPEYMRGTNTTVPFVFTIHNIAFHGNAPAEKLATLGLDPSRFKSDSFEFWGQISALKAGLIGADRINTVSQTYAEELLTPDFGIGMDGVLRSRQADLSGIVNGIDLSEWNPETDRNIKPFKAPTGKAANKQALRKTFKLGASSGPLCVLVSRLTEQKGIDLLLDALPVLLDNGGQLALLGSGDPKLEVALAKAAENHKNLSVKIGYDEALSHQMMAGGDAILVPSRFEPCGLTQLYGLRYGTVPVVALTGGLADTVINASPAALARKVATGIQFFPINAQALSNAFVRLIDVFADKKMWRVLQRNGMKQPVGWKASSQAYKDIYDTLTEAKHS